MSLQAPIERWINRLFFQQEVAFGSSSDEPVSEFTGKTRFNYGPVHGQMVTQVGVNRLRVKSDSGVTHWEGACESEYSQGPMIVEVLKLLFELVSESANTPSDGLKTYQFRQRRLAPFRTAKLGLEYEPTGPFYIMHGVALDSFRLGAVARGKVKFQFGFKARELEEVPQTRTYNHDDLTQYHQYNFRSEVIGGPCYEGGVSGLSCRLSSADTLLGTQNGFAVATEDGYAISLFDESLIASPQVGTRFHVSIRPGLVSAMEFQATEFSLNVSEPKTPARFGRDRKPDAFKQGQGSMSGELALYHCGDDVPNTVALDMMAGIFITAEFGGGKSISVSLPRVKLSGGTPDLVSRQELVYRVPFSVLEMVSENAADSSITLVI